MASTPLLALVPCTTTTSPQVKAFTTCVRHFAWISYQFAPHVLTQAFSHRWGLPMRFRVARWRSADTARYKEAVS